jgi:4-oxalmesaconate hydratase
VIIDSHGHVTMPPEATAFQANLVASRGAPSWHLRPPSISDDAIEAAVAPHLRLLREVGTDRQLISPRPYAMMHSVPPERVSRAWTGFVNDIIARQCQLHPDVLVGVAALPQFRDASPAAAVYELERCVRELGFVGCLLNPDPMEGSEPRVPALGDEFWYPLYEKLVELDVPALIHSASCSSERESYTLHFINEETTAILSLIESGVFRDFPGLKIVVAHGGGAVPYQIGRFRAGALRESGGEPFEQSMRRLYFDTCIHSARSIELLIQTVGADRVLFGTETPGTGTVVNPDTGRYFDDLKPVIESLDSVSETDRALIFEGNATRLYNLKPEV